jgi:hypothetical protein
VTNHPNAVQRGAVLRALREAASDPAHLDDANGGVAPATLAAEMDRHPQTIRDRLNALAAGDSVVAVLGRADGHGVRTSYLPADHDRAPEADP